MKDFAINLAKQAGKIIKENFGKIEKIELKSRSELVTNVDKKIDDFVVKKIKETYPEHSILTEESGKHGKKSDYTWIIDPLDGTHNFIHKIPLFSVSIALAHKDKVILGILYFPMTDELYAAEKGKGAFLNGKKINVSSRNLKEQNLMTYDAHIGAGDKEFKLKIINTLADYINKFRIFGCATVNLAYVASGKSDLGILINAKPWDFAAGALIVEEANGKVTNMQGNPYKMETSDIVASNNKFHDKIIELLKWNKQLEQSLKIMEKYCL